jgi:hypothetical protein
MGSGGGGSRGVPVGVTSCLAGRESSSQQQRGSRPAHVEAGGPEFARALPGVGRYALAETGRPAHWIGFAIAVALDGAGRCGCGCGSQDGCGAPIIFKTRSSLPCSGGASGTSRRRGHRPGPTVVQAMVPTTTRQTTASSQHGCWPLQQRGARSEASVVASKTSPTPTSHQGKGLSLLMLLLFLCNLTSTPPPPSSHSCWRQEPVVNPDVHSAHWGHCSLWDDLCLLHVRN